MWLVVGLGNPGEEYAATRHNAGFRVVEAAAADWGVALGGRRHRSRTAEVRRGGEKIVLAQPQTFMNLSGEAVTALVRAHGTPLERILVVYDDLDLELGEVRVRKGGSAGTHNGMRSVVRSLGTTEFPRIRVGIGPMPPGVDPAAWVTSKPRAAERADFERGLERAREALETVLDDGIEKAMNRFNRKAPAAD